VMHISSSSSLQTVQVTYSVAQVGAVWASGSDVVCAIVPSSIG
jgi:hypothetical protein